jgi:hypothetical protein
LHQGNLRKVIEADFRKLPDFLARINSNGAASVAETTAAAPVPAHLRAQLAEEAAVVASVTPSEPEPQQMRLL